MGADTAFGWRDMSMVVVYAFWTRTTAGASSDGDAAHVQWAKSISHQLEPYSEGFSISNSSFEEASDTERCFPADIWARVRSAKLQFDPHSLFRDLDFHQ